MRDNFEGFNKAMINMEKAEKALINAAAINKALINMEAANKALIDMEDPIRTMSQQALDAIQAFSVHADALSNSAMKAIEQQEKVMRCFTEPVMGSVINALENYSELMIDPAEKISQALMAHDNQFREQEAAIVRYMENVGRQISKVEKYWSLPEVSTRRVELPRPVSPTDPAPRVDEKWADIFVHQISNVIDEAMEELEVDQELIIQCSTPAGEIIAISEFESIAPHTIVIRGVNKKGEERNVVAHMQTVSFEFRKVKISVSEKRKIGF